MKYTIKKLTALYPNESVKIQNKKKTVKYRKLGVTKKERKHYVDFINEKKKI